MEYYSAIRKDDFPTFAATWMEQEEIMLREISQAERLSYGFTYLWNIGNSMEEIRRRNGKMKGGNQRGRQTMKDYGLRETTEGFRGEGGGGMG